MKYQSSSTHCSKVISKVKVSERMTEWQNDGMTEWQNDGMTEWQTGQKQYPPDLQSRGKKIKNQQQILFINKLMLWNQ